MRVLIVEDERPIAEPLAEGLRREGFEVEWTATGAAALEADEPDVVLLDLRLPDMDGLDVCRSIRARSDVPIIIVTARGEESDRVVGLELGADDYVVKPFGLRELIARIRAVTRRVRTAPASTDRCRSGSSRSIRAHDAYGSSGRELDLTPKEFDLLAMLAAIPVPWSPAAACSTRSGRRAGTDPRRRSTCTSPRCAASSATPAGSRPSGVSASACARGAASSSAISASSSWCSPRSRSRSASSSAETSSGPGDEGRARRDDDRVDCARHASETTRRRAAGNRRRAYRYRRDTGGRVVIVNRKGVA